MDKYEAILDFCNSPKKEFTNELDSEKDLIDFEAEVFYNVSNINTKSNSNSNSNINSNFLSCKKETKIRKLLLTLQNALNLINVKWKPVEFNDLLEIKQIKKIYNKAMCYVHPDKCINLNDTDLKIAKEIYDCLYEAYQKEIC